MAGSVCFDWYSCPDCADSTSSVSANDARYRGRGLHVSGLLDCSRQSCPFSFSLPFFILHTLYHTVDTTIYAAFHPGDPMLDVSIDTSLVLTSSSPVAVTDQLRGLYGI